MIEVDWTWLERINLFQIAVVIVALYVIARLLMRFWPWLRKVIALGDALGQLPTFISETKATLNAQNDLLGTIKHEVLPNHGGSLRDAVDEVNKKLAKDHDRIELLEHTIPRDELGRFSKREE